MIAPYREDATTTLYLGDCRNVLPTLAPESISLVCTDPPYGVNFSHGQEPSNRWASRFNDVRIVGDAAPFDPVPLLQFRRLVLFGANHYADKLPSSPTWLVWDKRDASTVNSMADCELIWSNCGGPARLFHHLWNGFARASEKDIARVHPTQKPVALMVWLLEQFSRPGDVILDPYMGSGTTLVAAKMLGRKAIGVEIEERYCEIAVRRLQQQVMTFDGLVPPAAPLAAQPGLFAGEGVEG